MRASFPQLTNARCAFALALKDIAMISAALSCWHGDPLQFDDDLRAGAGG
jgi:hypothetical protein